MFVLLGGKLIHESLILSRLAHELGYSLFADPKFLGYILLELKIHQHLVDDLDLIADANLCDSLLPLALCWWPPLYEVRLADGSVDDQSCSIFNLVSNASAFYLGGCCFYLLAG